MVVVPQIMDLITEKNNRMTLNDLKEEYHSATSKASALLRNINYSLIAVVWILCGQNVDYIIGRYKYVLVFLLVSLAIDFLQYFSKGFVGQRCYLKEERHHSDNDEVDGYPKYLRRITTTCYYGKIVSTVVAVAFLLIQLLFGVVK